MGIGREGQKDRNNDQYLKENLMFLGIEWLRAMKGD